MTDQLLTPEDLAERFKLTPKKVLELRKRHDWPCVRLGRRIRFTEDQIAQIIAAQTVEAKPQASASGLTALSAARRRHSAGLA